MEARMARIENMMESLMLERGISLTPRISAERDAASSERFHADFLMQIAGEASLAFPSISQGELNLDSPQRIRHSVSAINLSSNADAQATLRVGMKMFAFPSPAEYQKYLGVFFDDIGPYYPCINELEFRINSEKMLSAPSIQADSISLLALNYIVFASVDIATTLGQLSLFYL